MTVNNTDQAEVALPSRASGQKPYVVFAAAPAEGHARPLIRLAADLVKNRGYECSFITSASLQSAAEKAGASFTPCPEMITPELLAAREALPPNMVRTIYDLEHAFVRKIPERWTILKQVLEDVREQRPSQEVIIVTEVGFLGTLPMMYNCPLPKGYTTRPKVILLGTSCYCANSIDAAPFGAGLPFDSTESGRMRNKVIHDLMLMGPFAGIDALTGQLLGELGATGYTPSLPTQVWYTTADITLQLCTPKMEYPYTDIYPTVKFAGSLPTVPLAADFVYPPFWDEVTSSQKPVVVVTQGTVATDFSDLIVPTIQALAKREDILLVVILGVKDAKLDSSVEIPANTRVIDYLNYDAILPHSSVFIMNGGYGGVMHSVAHGVPLVVAGSTEDKPEVTMRVEHAGVGINLRTGAPTSEQVGEAVGRILTDPSFKKKIMEAKAENEALNVHDIFEETIRAQVGEKQ